MGHNRKLVLGGVSLVKIRLRHTGSALASVGAELENVLIEENFFQDAPFRWIGLILRYGIKNDSEPQYDKIDKNDGELPIAIEVDMNPLVNADLVTLLPVFRQRCLIALIHVANKYGLPSAKLKTLLNI